MVDPKGIPDELIDALLANYEKQFIHKKCESSTTARGGGLNVPPRRGLYHRVAVSFLVFERDDAAASFRCPSL